MQFNIPLGTTVIDSAAMEARLQAVDPAALVDAEAGMLRVSSSLSEHELASLLAAAGLAVDASRIERVPSECCGGCGG